MLVDLAGQISFVVFSFKAAVPGIFNHHTYYHLLSSTAFDHHCVASRGYADSWIEVIGFDEDQLIH